MRRAWPVVRLTGGIVVLAVLLGRFGTGPFREAWRVTTWWSVAAAVLLTAVATAASAWRWRVVARALGAPLSVVESVTAYYRSQLLNATLPGGILGDAHRAVRHGRSVGGVGLGLRATAWDRAAGQVVQAGLLVVALLVLPSPLRTYAPLALTALAALGVLTWRLGRTVGFLDRDLHALARPGVVLRLACLSALSCLAHLAVFVVALVAVGVHTSPASTAVVGLVVLAGSAVPLNVAGWGPREGVTVAAFAVVGLGPATGLTVSVVFGVLATVATAPGLLVLLADAVAVRRRSAPVAPSRVLEESRRG